MSGTFARLENAIDRGLRSHARAVAQEGKGRWRMASGKRRRIPIEGRLDGSWFVLQAPLQPSMPGRGSDRGGESNWKLLAAVADFSPLTKVVLDARRGAFCVRAEFPAGRGIDAERRAGEACAGVEKALARPGRGPRRNKRRRGAGAAAGRLEELMSEAGWSFERSDDVTGSVGLETSRGSYRAVIVDCGGGGIDIGAALGPAMVPGDVSRRAIASFLLSAAGALRLVRATVEEGPGGAITPRFEVSLPEAPAVTEIDHALAALTAACEHCGPEVQALVEEGLAEQYLLARGSAACRRQTVETARAS